MEPGVHPDTALLLFCFLNEGDCHNPELRNELACLECLLKPITLADLSDSDEDLQTDGHSCSSPLQYLGDLRPRLNLQWRADPMHEEAVRNVAAGLIEIADQLERRMVSQATMNLMKNLQSCAKECWKFCLSEEVQKLYRSLSPSLEYLPKERLMLAVTFTLVKGVCERYPHRFHSFFNMAVRFVCDPS